MISRDPAAQLDAAATTCGTECSRAQSALIAAAENKDYPAEIALVLSNRADAGGLLVAQSEGAVTEVIEHTAFGKDRAAFDAAMQAVLLKHKIDIVCLAGFMRLLTPGFVAQWPLRMLNIHPSLLPALKGLDTHKRALETSAAVHGATVHFVTAELDSGPVIVQAAVAVQKDDDESILAVRVLKQEHRIYPLALKLVAEGRVRVENGRCCVDGVAVPSSASLVPSA